MERSEVLEERNDPVHVKRNDPVHVEQNDQVPEERNDPVHVERNDPVPEERNDPVPEERNDPVHVERNDSVPEERNDPVPEERNDPVPEERNDLVHVERCDPVSEERNDQVPEERNDPVHVERNDPVPEERCDPVSEEQNDQDPVEQVEQPPPIVEPLNLLDKLPIEMFCTVMDLLELWEQFTVRRVCHSWKNKIEECMFFDVPKECLKLNVKKAMIGPAEQGAQCVRTWRPNESHRRMYFNFMYKASHEMASREMAQISIWDRAFNSDAAQAIGRMFSKVKTLIIYWDTDDSEVNIDNLVAMLSQLAEFTDYPKISNAINAHLAPLKQLHLLLPGVIDGQQQGGNQRVRPMQPTFGLDNIIESVTSISLTGNWNIDGFLRMLGSGAKFDGLCIPLGNRENDINRIIAALESNKDKFSDVKRLLLTYVVTCDIVQRVLVYFPNLEQLFLNFYIPSREIFGPKWIRIVSPLIKLTELSLMDFLFERKSLGWGSHIGNFDEAVNLSQVRKLTFSLRDLFFHIRMASNPSNTPLIPQLKPEDIADTISMRFPGLQELSMWSGDGRLHQTGERTWQQLQRHINRQLPHILPLLPGLRVDIRLCHTVMNHAFCTVPDILKRFYVVALAKSDAYRLGAGFVFLNEIIERRTHRNDQTPQEIIRSNVARLDYKRQQDEAAARANVPPGGVHGPVPPEEDERVLPDGCPRVSAEMNRAVGEFIQLRRELAAAQVARVQAPPNKPNNPNQN